LGNGDLVCVMRIVKGSAYAIITVSGDTMPIATRDPFAIDEPDPQRPRFEILDPVFPRLAIDRASASSALIHARGSQISSITRKPLVIDTILAIKSATRSRLVSVQLSLLRANIRTTRIRIVEISHQTLFPPLLTERRIAITGDEGEFGTARLFANATLVA